MAARTDRNAQGGAAASANGRARWRGLAVALVLSGLMGLALPAGAADLAPSTPVAGARADGPGQGIVWRALDHLADATVKAPGLDRAYRALVRSGMLGNPNPFSRYEPPRDRLDLLVTLPVDKIRKAFEQRQALYLAPEARVGFRVKVPASARLRLAVGRKGWRARVRIEADSEVLWKGRARWNEWQELDLDLGRFAGREVQLSFASSGRGHVLLADPSIVAPRGGGPNVLLVMVDTLATWAIGCYGQKLPITPNMDRLCREGTRFENAIANSNWTRPSMLSFLSSWLPGRTGISYDRFYGLNIAAQRDRFYRRRPDLLPLLLRRAGYRTAALANNLFLQGYHKYGVDQGFGQVVDYRRYSKDTVDITDRAIAFMTAHREQRFFLMLNYNAPHVLYVPPRHYRRQVRKMSRKLPPKTAAYLGEVRYTDAEIGRLLGALDRLRLSPNTLVVLFADHGEVHDPEHSYKVVRTGRSSRYSHAVTLYDEEIRVPLVLRQPGKIPAGRRVRAQVPLLDLAPSILEHLGLPGSVRYQGRSFLNLVRGGSDLEERVVFLAGRRMLGLRSGGFKYIKRLDGYQRIVRGRRIRRVPEELYDLTRDPREHRDLASDPAQAGRLARLRNRCQQIVAWDAAPAPLELPPAPRRQRRKAPTRRTRRRGRVAQVPAHRRRSSSVAPTPRRPN